MVTKEQRYHSGEDLHAGDVVRYGGVSGVIVFVNDRDEYLSGFSGAEWSYLGSGFMVRQENNALIYLKEADEDLQFIQRA